MSVTSADQLRAKFMRLTEQVQQAAQHGEDVSALQGRVRELEEQTRTAEAERDQRTGDLRDLMLGIPNLPLDELPDGDSEDFAMEIRRHGNPPSFAFEPKDHVDLGEAMGILDFARAAKLSGPRFSVARGPGAVLERGLAAFFLDLHTQRHGYLEYSLPALVTRETMTRTGQLPKGEDSLFKTSVGSRDLFLIPTAEVPLTNLYADEIIDSAALPLALTAYTPCYRSEADSYDRDTRGILRLHQFTKVEMIRICAASQSQAELQIMIRHAEACLKGLGLAYRVMLLAAGDMSFSAQATYDIEVWLPGQRCYREISSCSDCGTFQGRRANIRTRDQNGKICVAATLNGSGLPISRTVAAILENNQQPDGSVVMPDALVPYLGFKALSPDGTPQM